MAKKVQTSKADFNRFKGYCIYYLGQFGITDYEIVFKHKSLDDDTLAETKWYTERETKNITFTLAANWNPTEITNDTLDATAFHEVLHVFLLRLNVLASDRFCNEVDIHEECHILINRIMKAFTTR